MLGYSFFSVIVGIIFEQFLRRNLKNPLEMQNKSSFKHQIKSSLYLRYYAEACNELRGPSPRLSAWATRLQRNVATMASRWRHCVDLTGPGIEPQTSRTDSVRLATELTAGLNQVLKPKLQIYVKIIRQNQAKVLPTRRTTTIK